VNCIWQVEDDEDEGVKEEVEEELSRKSDGKVARNVTTPATDNPRSHSTPFYQDTGRAMAAA